VREDGRIVGGEGWQDKVHNREEWKKLLRMARESSHSAHAKGINECWMQTNKHKNKKNRINKKLLHFYIRRR
jgi:hypothetical protein